MTSRLVRRRNLAAIDREAMFTLLTAHFLGVERRTFDRDLAEKNWVLLLTDGARLVGFTTLLAYDVEYDARKISVVCSGDTIVARDGWHAAALPRSWIAAVRRIRETELDGERLYWLLLTSGIRTYRLLPGFWRDFHPRHDAPMPEPVRKLLAALAADRFGTAYRPDTGTVVFSAPQILREHLREISPGRIADPHVAFFLRRNPGWCRGDELACLVEIAFDNLTPAGRRMWGSDARHNVSLGVAACRH
jgi:hypothetical protein